MSTPAPRAKAWLRPARRGGWKPVPCGESRSHNAEPNSARGALLNLNGSAGLERVVAQQLDRDRRAVFGKWHGRWRDDGVEGGLPSRIRRELHDLHGYAARATRRALKVDKRGVHDTGRETAERLVEPCVPIRVDLDVGGAADAGGGQLVDG